MIARQVNYSRLHLSHPALAYFKSTRLESDLNLGAPLFLQEPFNFPWSHVADISFLGTVRDIVAVQAG